MSPQVFEGAGLSNQKTCPFLLSTRDRESDSRCLQHVHCKSQPRRVLSKLASSTGLLNCDQRPPVCQALRRPGLRGSLNLAPEWEVPPAWKWCQSSVISQSQPHVRQSLSILVPHKLSQELRLLAFLARPSFVWWRNIGASWTAASSFGLRASGATSSRWSRTSKSVSVPGEASLRARRPGGSSSIWALQSTSQHLRPDLPV